MRQQKAVREHNAWFSIDLMSPKSPTRGEKAQCYRKMCQLAAEFVDLNCLGVSFPETGHLRPYDREIQAALRNDRPLRTILDWTNDPVVMAEDADAQLQAAASRARARRPEFVLACQHRRPKPVAVKKLFRDGDKGEWMWVQTATIDADVVEGSIINSPVDVRNVAPGDSVRESVSESETRAIPRDGERSATLPAWH